MVAEENKYCCIFVEPEYSSQRQSRPRLPISSRMNLTQAQARMFLWIRESDFQI